ncbi:MAG: MATE family efflux transporter [Eubacteriales bacterium]|nr:MATE family efflux transporter [Eubacteriales bacterium]
MGKVKNRGAFRGEVLFTNQALWALILPLFMEQLLTALVGLCDSIMVAQVGEAAVSAVSLVDSVMILIINIFNALATGGAVVAGQYLGSRQKEEANRAGKQMMQFMILLSTGLMLLLYIFKSVLLRVVFGSIEADVMYNCNLYYIICMASVPFLAVYCGGAALFRSVGNSKISMIISIIMNLVNISGNAILVFGFHRGVEGVAIPTLVSRIVAAAMMTAYLRNPSFDLNIRDMKLFRFEGRMIKKILYIGIPNGVENSMFQLGKILLLSLIATFGTNAIAANAVSNSLAYFEILPGMALGLATVTVISRCIGAGDYPQAQYFAKRLLKYTYVSMWVTNGITLAALPLILKIYHLSAQTSGFTRDIMVFHSIMAMIFWPLSFTLPNVFRAANDVRFTMIVGVFSMWAFRIVCAFVFGKYMGMGVFGAWVAMVLDWVVRSGFFILRYKSGKWKGKALIKM